MSPRLLLGALAGALLMAGSLNAQVVGIGTNPQGSLYYSVGAAVAKVMQEKAGVTARVQPMAGSSTYAPLLNRGELEYGLLNVIDVANAYKGVDNFKGRENPNIRLVCGMFSLPIGIAVANNAPYKSIKDLKGVRMPSQFTAQSTIRTVQDAVLATGGVSTADMKPVPVANYVKGMELLGDGTVDAALMGPGSGTSREAHAKLSSQGGMRFIPLDNSAAAMKRMTDVMPGTYFTMMEPSNALPGIIGPTRIMAYTAFLVSGKDVSDEVVYKTVKAIHQNQKALAESSTTLSRFDPKDMAEANAVPYHPGAEKYYREAGMWPPKQR